MGDIVKRMQTGGKDPIGVSGISFPFFFTYLLSEFLIFLSYKKKMFDGTELWLVEEKDT